MKKIIYFFICYLFFVPSIAQLTINEFSANRGYIDEDLDSSDWIEIINTSDTAVQLSNYYLSDDLLELDKWQFPDEILNPMDIILVCASDKNRNYRTKHWESIILSDNEWRYFIGNEEPVNNWNDLSFNSNWGSGFGGFGYGDNDDNTIIELTNNAVSIYLRKVFTIEDLDELSQLVLHADYDDAFVAYLNGVEIMRSDNISGYPPAYDITADWDHEANLWSSGEIESKIFSKENLMDLLSSGSNVLAIQVHNVSSTSSDMSSNFFLSAGISTNNYFYQETPDWFDLDAASTYHTNFKLSNNEHVVISSMNGTVLDSTIVDNDLSSGISKGRSPDGLGEWCYFNTPTPYDVNGDSWCYIGITPEPELLPSGWYDVGDSSLMVGISSSIDVDFHYTINGDVPTNSDDIYVEPLSFSTTTILSLQALGDDNFLPGKLIDRTYIINEDNHDLPVFSVFTDSVNLWDNDEGIYVFGSAPSSNYPFSGANFWQPWSKWSRLEYFDGNQIKRAEEEFDLEIHGGWSRAEPQKSFRFDFKSDYTGRLDWPVISEKSFIEDFNNINLRNGGQHTYSDKIQDGLISRTIQDTHADNMAYQPCILYLNGEYWGIYGIREKIDEHYIEDNFGYNDSEVDLLNSWNTLAGSDAHFVEAYNQIMSMDVDDFNYYDFVNSKFDLDNYKDYFIIQTYIQNSDWMGIWWGLNNTKLWRPQTEDGRWRYVVYDTDAAFGYFGTWVSDNYINWARYADNPHANIFNNLLNNSQFQCEFINRYADLINTIFQPSNLNDIAGDIQNELSSMGMSNHIDRWQFPDAFDPSYWYDENWMETIGSIPEWNADIESILYYNFQRIDEARQHIIDEFNLDGQYDVSLDVYPENSGTINISTITPDNYPWVGVYFNSCPIHVNAIAKPGYAFDYWELVNSDISTSDSTDLELNINEDISLIAHFIECDYVLNAEECIAPPCEIGTVYISEVHNLGEPEDYIEIYNSGDVDCSLASFMLDDEQPFDDYVFNDTIIPAGGYWLGYEDAINSFSSGLSANGETIYFGDLFGNISSTIIETSIMTVDSILLSQIFDADGIGCYSIESPGFNNNDCLVEGCMNFNAVNYNEFANYDNGTCEYPEIIYGCMDLIACNYNLLATENDDSCNYNCIGCTDSTACNYEDDNTIDNGTCEYPFIGYNCSGECLLDSDGDNVCDMYEIEGCTDMIACNYENTATDDNNSCEYPLEIYLSCDNNCINDTDLDGVCDEIEILGCMSILACNYSSIATDSDLSCVFPIGCETCSQDGGVIDNDFDNDGVCDSDEIIGCMDVLACNYNTIATDSDLSCVFATGCESCAQDGNVVNNDLDNDGICDSDEIAGCTNFLYEEYTPAATDDDGSCLTLSLDGCMDSSACNYNPAATDEDGSCYNNDLGCGCDQPAAILGYDCDYNCLNDVDNDGVCDEFEVPGCMDLDSCGYNPEATDNDNSCTYPIELYLDCDGVCINDTDSDGVCDEIELVGCIDDVGCNYNPLATDSGTCIYPLELYLDCNGVCINDLDADGVCNELEILGCIDVLACNYNLEATDNDNSCYYAIDFYNCNNVCINDTDSDGVCDELEIEGCTIMYACNYNPTATDNDGSCEFESCSGCTDINACNYCSNCVLGDNSACIYPITFLNCEGSCVNDGDSDGVCDELETPGCQDEFACNYNPNSTDPCFGDETWSWWVPDYCCEYPGAINGLVYLDCNNNCINDIDGDGICDEMEVEGCTDNNACNYITEATDNNGTCIYPGDNCIISLDNQIYGVYNDDCVCIENLSSIHDLINYKKLIKTLDLLGREISPNRKYNILLYIYSDGSVDKKYLMK